MYNLVIHSLPSPNIKSLNTSMSTRFGNILLESLLREMLMKTWIGNDTRFDQFYNKCAPISCSYTIVQRRNIIVVLLLISIYSGLTQGRRIFVPLIGKFIFFYID